MASISHSIRGLFCSLHATVSAPDDGDNNDAIHRCNCHRGERSQIWGGRHHNGDNGSDNDNDNDNSNVNVNKENEDVNEDDDINNKGGKVARRRGGGGGKARRREKEESRLRREVEVQGQTGGEGGDARRGARMHEEDEGEGGG